MRNYCGHILPDGLIKNQILDDIKLTPTTKSDLHDELISAVDVVSTRLMTQNDWDICARYAHALFRYGQAVAMEQGLILVDTKYEFGSDSTLTYSHY
jgi:phosphoribosylaminoimidazole-succinocarboxamide synthase